MAHDKMKSLIFDRNVLVYIHDVMYLKEHQKEFLYSKTYKTLTETGRMTVYRYTKQTRYALSSFVILLLFMKSLDMKMGFFSFVVYFVLACIYGVIFVWCMDDFKMLRYQLKAKKAVLYALKHYNYQEFVVFLDKYLSEESTKNHLKLHKN